MSIWTHVAGLIRIDSLPISGLPQHDEFMMAAWFVKGVPSGSEGPIQLAVHRIVHPREEGNIRAIYPQWGYLVLHGDLRDFDWERIHEIEDWLNERCRAIVKPQNNIIVRQGVVSAEIEGKGSKTWIYYPEAEEWR